MLSLHYAILQNCISSVIINIFKHVLWLWRRIRRRRTRLGIPINIARHYRRIGIRKIRLTRHVTRPCGTLPQDLPTPRCNQETLIKPSKRKMIRPRSTH